MPDVENHLPIEVSILSPSNVSGSSASADVGSRVRQNASTRNRLVMRFLMCFLLYIMVRFFHTCLTIAGKAYSFVERYHTVGTTV